jgi:ATPase subunit of ABC transporter with duplicated ATPase domains
MAAGFLAAVAVSYVLPDGEPLFSDVSFQASEGDVVALVGANGAGKSTLLRLLAGQLPLTEGHVRSQGGLVLMPQSIGSADGDLTVRELLLAVAPAPLRAAAAALDAVELELMDVDDEPTQLRYANALTEWGERGGYEAEVHWDNVTTRALGVPYDRAKFRTVDSLSSGERKRLVLEALMRGPERVLLLDEPDNYLDVPGKLWLEQQLQATSKAVMLISHDRELLAAAATHIVTVEAGTAWTHGGGFASWPEARDARWDRVAELRRRWHGERDKLNELVRKLRQQAKLSDVMASRYHAAQTRLRKFELAGPPPEVPREEKVKPRLRGSRSGVRALTCTQLELTGLMKPFDLEVFFGDRVCVLGSNGSGKSHFLRLIRESASDDQSSVRRRGECRLGARVQPGLFRQTAYPAEWRGRTLTDILWHGDGERCGVDRGQAMSALNPYGLTRCGDQHFETLSGGQQARFQILLLELSGANLLLLDEPTDNLDLISSEALQKALEQFTGTVVAVSHDRWFAKAFDRFVLFTQDGVVIETDEPVWDEGRGIRPR